MQKISRTLVILKPECIENCIVGSVLQFFDNQGLRSVQMKQMRGSEYQMREHYKDVIAKVGKEIGDSIVARMTRGDCIFIIYTAVSNTANAVISAREILGATDPLKAEPGTIRAHFGGSVQYNTAHASDSIESAEREITLWFPHLTETKPIIDRPLEYHGC